MCKPAAQPPILPYFYTMTKIVIAGIGGVGGYFGGLLAKHFAGSASVQIHFLARGRHLAAIQQQGLTVIKGATQFIAKPASATDDAATIGVADFILICTKGYDLEATIEQLKPCIGRSTVIIPLLNGVDARQRICSLVPGNMVLDGCVYLVARLTAPGRIENTGNIQQLYFGLDGCTDERLVLLESILTSAGIEATLSKNISAVIWEKFIFIAPVATATSYFDTNSSSLADDGEKLAVVTALINEATLLARAKGIAVNNDILAITLKKISSLAPGTTSSMHADFKSGRGKTELQSLTGYVAGEAKKYGLVTPVFDKLFTALSK
jgi:2-dehydropantoate 2-reductase